MAIGIESLDDGHRALLAAATGPHELTITSVEVRYAAAVRELVRGERWTCLNKSYLVKLVRADSVLLLIECSILPALCVEPTSERWIPELRRYGDKLKSIGKRVGGTFTNLAISLAKRIKHHASDCTQRRRSPGALGRRARRLCNRVSALRDAHVNIGTK
ncbi:uncharacterized protein LOC133896238 [Phragmites australis]|uniref:uncharacterized protein LOC133896238 n=1 Tax=Phragmites australis TaxID=29695 RepID=UPI002D7818D1|nr:uncharacterized protein LOC133896238 [Phragmites australis]